MRPMWRIHIDFEQLPGETQEDIVAIFEWVERLVAPRIDPHEDGEDCVRFWAMGALDVTVEYEDDVQVDLADGNIGFVAENPHQWN